MPPSVNQLYRAIGKRNILSKEGRIWYQYAVPEIRAQANGWYWPGKVRLTLLLTFPDRRRCDISNRVKALEDAITKAGIWSDDCMVDHLVVERCPVSATNPGVLATISPL